MNVPREPVLDYANKPRKNRARESSGYSAVGTLAIAALIFMAVGAIVQSFMRAPGYVADNAGMGYVLAKMANYFRL